MVGTGALELAITKANNPGIFVKVLRDSKRLKEVDQKSMDKEEKIECRCRLTP